MTSSASFTPRLAHADSAADLHACFPVMHLLRPHLPDADHYVAQIFRMHAQGYRTLAAWDGDTPVGLAGYRVQENTLHGRFIYIDDLVVHSDYRSARVGAALISEVRRLAREELDCRRVTLDTALANALGQRFYFRQGMLATALHFGIDAA